jgi:hypothetical protein
MAISKHKGQVVPTGQFATRLQCQFFHRVVRVLVRGKRERDEVAFVDSMDESNDQLS